jgi:hypothetical protein
MSHVVSVNYANKLKKGCRLGGTLPGSLFCPQRGLRERGKSNAFRATSSAQRTEPSPRPDRPTRLLRRVFRKETSSREDLLTNCLRLPSSAAHICFLLIGRAGHEYSYEPAGTIRRMASSSLGNIQLARRARESAPGRESKKGTFHRNAPGGPDWFKLRVLESGSGFDLVEAGLDGGQTILTVEQGYCAQAFIFLGTIGALRTMSANSGQALVVNRGLAAGLKLHKSGQICLKVLTVELDVASGVNLVQPFEQVFSIQSASP